LLVEAEFETIAMAMGVSNEENPSVCLRVIFHRRASLPLAAAYLPIASDERSSTHESVVPAFDHVVPEC
jgi:hypothetical protein